MPTCGARSRTDPEYDIERLSNQRATLPSHSPFLCFCTPSRASGASTQRWSLGSFLRAASFLLSRQTTIQLSTWSEMDPDP